MTDILQIPMEEKVDFKNTVIIMTSNAGANRIIAPKHLGFSMDDTDKAKTHERMKKGVMEEVKQIFRPEFLNRIDETIVFAVLTKEEVKKIAKLFMDELRARLLSEHQITLKITSGAMDLLADKGYDENYGARPLRRIIQNEIEDVLADKILEGTLTNGQTMTIGKKIKTYFFGKGKLVNNTEIYYNIHTTTETYIRRKRQWQW